jgi:very-short-patch-repair endonuclease
MLQLQKKKLFEVDLLKEEIKTAINEAFDEYDDWAVGDTPIEKLFYAALYSKIKYDETEFIRVISPISDGMSEASIFDDPASKRCLIVKSQVQIDDWRVDFVVHAWTYGEMPFGPRLGGKPRWRRLIVECDGHDFHERTKEQAAKDRSRDRAVSLAGYDIFRFTGSELWNSPWGCADQVYQWATKGL